MTATIRIGDRTIGGDDPTYFIADIAANHDGDLERARALIRNCAEAGADAAKFQNFHAREIVSDYGFRALGGNLSHQASWKSSVYDTYDAASIPDEWTEVLADECRAVGIDYFSAPYDFAAIELLDPHVPAFKVGSGDITWSESIRRMAAKGKPVLLATGASDMGDVQRAVHAALDVNPQLCLMQCNTNYTASDDNFDHINLRVLATYRSAFPDVVLGLSDHTPGHATVLGAITLGARVVEKHFTDDNGRVGPDHAFSMDPHTWRLMVDASRQLERALGVGEKRVEANERETVVLQRRCLRAARDLAPGTVLTEDDVDVLRPATPGALLPDDLPALAGRILRHGLQHGQEIRWSDVD